MLVLAYMYPNKADCNSGAFIHEQMKSLKKLDCLINVISPIPFSPKILWFNSSWKSYGLVPEKDTIDEIPVQYPRYIRLPGKWFYGLSCYFMYWGIRKKISLIAREFKPDLIHAHMVTPAGYIGLMLGEKLKLPLVCSLRGSDIHTYPNFGRLVRQLTEKVILGADQLVSVSNALKIDANRIARTKKEIKRVYNGCDSHAIFYSEKARRDIRTKMGIAGNDKVLIYVGRMLKSKGVYELLAAFLNLNANYPFMRLILVGDGPERVAINNIIYSNNKIHLVGRIPHNEISQWLSASDIFVLPSYDEGLPNVILEAMACALPVVASRVGGIPEAVEDGQSGILVNKRDKNSLVKSIRYLLNNEELAMEMGRKGRRIIEQKFSWQRSAKEMINVYKELTKK